MPAFASEREAKEFLVSRILSEAGLEGLPLSEIERKELYFSETGWTLPGMKQIDEEFERRYDQDEYEQKIVALVRNARERDRQNNPEYAALWSNAIELLQKGDHYILVMISEPASLRPRPRGDFAKLLASAFGVVGVVLCSVSIANFLHVDLSRQASAFYLWVAAVSTAALYLILQIVLGRDRTNALVGRVLQKVFIRLIRTR